MRDKRDYREYWDRNIDKWGELYLHMSHGQEELAGPTWFASLYSSTIGHLERRLMAERYIRTVTFIDMHVKPGTVLSDLGCGTGLFVVEALRRGAVVNAIDFSSSAIEITQRNVATYCPDGKVNFQCLDVQADELPPSDVTLAMGLTPYLNDLAAFMDRALPRTRMLFCLFVDPKHWANRIRWACPLLNVRGLQAYEKGDVDRLYARHGWKLRERQAFGTGYIDLAIG
jgi:cyclopropane fatty-acyl-phospholipid synthase-like methyltransferase